MLTPAQRTAARTSTIFVCMAVNLCCAELVHKAKAQVLAVRQPAREFRQLWQTCLVNVQRADYKADVERCESGWGNFHAYK